MKLLFQLALLGAAAVLASADDSSGSSSAMTDTEFMSYLAVMGKDYTTMEELNVHRAQYEKAKAIVAHLNSDSNGNATYGMNYFADMTDTEFQELMQKEEEDYSDDESVSTSTDADGDRRRLESDGPARDRSINWKALGKVSPVKWQRHCASCALMTGTLVLESRYAIKYETDPVEVSVQEGVDCTMIQPCKSGNVPKYLRWGADNGVNLEADYPYEDKMGECGRHVETRKMEYSAERDSIKNIPYDKKASMVHRILDQLEDGPVAFLMGFDKDCWKYYKSGVLDSASCQTGGHDGYTHYMTIVGFHHARAGDGEMIGDGDEMEYNRTCRWATNEEREAGSCENEGETMAPNRIGEEDRKCCTYKPMQPIPGEGGDFFDMSKSYWIVQNSFSEYWGDKGLVYVAAEEGEGVSKLNTRVTYMQIKDTKRAH